MKGPAEATERHARYLLDLLPEPEREAMEQEFFADDTSFEALEAAEGELFDAFAAGRLSPLEQDAFRRRYLSEPEGRQRLTFARALRQRSLEAVANPSPKPEPARKTSVVLWATLAAGLVAAVIAAWLYVQNGRLRNEMGRLLAERSSPAPSVSPAPATVHPEPTAVPERRPDTVAVRLPAQSSRTPVVLTLAAGTRAVRLEVPLTGHEDSATFDAIIRQPGGEELWRQDGLAPKRFGAPIVVMAPAEWLADGDYELSLEGEPSREAAGSSRRTYRLRVSRGR